MFSNVSSNFRKILPTIALHSLPPLKNSLAILQHLCCLEMCHIAQCNLRDFLQKTDWFRASLKTAANVEL